MSNTKKIHYLTTIAAFIALFIGAMSVFAGTKVLLGIDTKTYTTLIWLLAYNVFFGVISIGVAFLILKNKLLAKLATYFVLASHFVVFLYLKFVSEIVASESIKAMLFRISIWIIIVVLSIIIPNYLIKKIN
ncbi:MAG: hypothetical protein L3J09_01805 [Flavobacteriaceae bacterium]|nr:hypothetical protein [Flavobacteriaceae bacterium]